MKSASMMISALTAALTLAGCAFAPPAKPPASPSPAHYTAAPTPTASANVDGVTQHFSLGERAVPVCWM